MFGFASELSPDRALITAVLVFVALGGGALMLTVAVAVGPHDYAAGWLVAGALLGLTGSVLSFGDLRKMTDSGGRSLAAPWRVMLELSLWMVAVVAVCHGLSSDLAITAIAMLPVFVLWVIFGDLPMVVAGFGLGVVLLVIEAVARPSTTEPTLRVLLVVIAAFLTVGVMTKLVAAGSVAAVRDFGLLNEMGVIAARAHSLESSLEAFMPMAASLVRADRIVAFRLSAPDELGPEVPRGHGAAVAIARWDRDPSSPEPDGPIDGTEAPGDEVGERPSGAHTRAGRSWIWARAPDGTIVALGIDGRRSWFETQTSWQYRFDRIVPELEALVTLTGFIAQLSEMTRTDYLTGLANRRAFMDRLTQEVAGVERRNDDLTVAMLDLDHFKAFNDEHGHLLGDQLLRGFASLLLARSRATDLASRYGGEEFCLILPNTNLDGAVQLLADLHGAGRGLSDPMGVTFSAGVSSWRPGDDPESLLARADVGLYRAKSSGRDQTAVIEADREKDEAGPR